MLDFTTLLILFIVLGLTYLYMKARVPAGMPPGPKGWPIIGHLDLMYRGDEKKIHVLTANWGKKYGGVFNMQYCQTSSIMVTDLDMMRETLIDQADIWSDRPLHNDFMRLISPEDSGGVFFNNGETWKQLRRLTLRSLRDFGVGKQSLEDKIREELNEILREIGSHDGKPFKFDLIFNKAVANVICSILFGKRFSYDDPAYQKLISDLNYIFKYSGFQNIFVFMPWYSFWLIPVLQPRIAQLLKMAKRMKAFIKTIIDGHRESFDKDNIRDFVDLYLEAEKNEESSIFTEKRMFDVISDLFLAGGETTSTSLLWAILFLIKHPHVQDRCRAEIKQNIGFERQPVYADKKALPYVQATISEMIRLGSVAPIISFHNSSASTKVKGYTIPKDTLLMVNAYAIHMDPKHWDNPKQFRPERFLDSDGNYQRVEGYVAFGLGRRACPGESLARMELFLFLTGILQKYKFRTDDLDKLPSVDDTSLGITLIPSPYSVIAEPIA